MYGGGCHLTFVNPCTLIEFLFHYTNAIASKTTLLVESVKINIITDYTNINL